MGSLARALTATVKPPLIGPARIAVAILPPARGSDWKPSLMPITVLKSALSRKSNMIYDFSELERSER